MPARKGPGSIRQRGNGYEFYLDERLHGRSGRQVRRGGYATEEDAALALALHRNQQRRSECFVDAPYTLTSVAEAWVPQMQVKETTRERYARDVRVHLEPTLGERPFDEVTTREIVDLFEGLRSDGGRGNRNFEQPLSHSSLCGIYTVLRQMYQWAFLKGLVTESPVAGLDRRVFVGREQAALDLQFPIAIEAINPSDAFTIEEMYTFVDALGAWKGQRANRDGHQWREAWLIALATGIRLGELLGLTDTHVNQREGILHIRQQLTCVGHTPVLTGPKSKKSVRDLPIGENVISLFRDQQRRRARYRNEAGGHWPVHERLFVHPDGRSPHPERFSREFARFLRVTGQRPIEFHGLRHTWATRGLEAGVPLSVVSAQLGHSDERITAAVYQQVTREFAREGLIVAEQMLDRPSTPKGS
jgi:integrase